MQAVGAEGALRIRVAIVSDTHVPRFAARFGAALARIAAEGPEIIVHCGDMTELSVVTALEAIAPVRAVAGNNDGPDIVARFGRRTTISIAGALLASYTAMGRAGRASAARSERSRGNRSMRSSSDIVTCRTASDTGECSSSTRDRRPISGASRASASR